MSGHSHLNLIVSHRNVIDEIDDVLAQPGIFAKFVGKSRQVLVRKQVDLPVILP